MRQVGGLLVENMQRQQIKHSVSCLIAGRQDVFTIYRSRQARYIVLAVRFGYDSQYNVKFRLGCVEAAKHEPHDQRR